jgi:dipeptidase E
MPIIEPASFRALEFFPFQINPHYYNQVTEGFNGETRDQRLEEYLQLNPETSIVGLPEGTALQLEHNTLRYIGNEPAILFSKDNAGPIQRKEIANGSDLSSLLRSE